MLNISSLALRARLLKRGGVVCKTSMRLYSFVYTPLLFLELGVGGGHYCWQSACTVSLRAQCSREACKYTFIHP